MKEKTFGEAKLKIEDESGKEVLSLYLSSYALQSPLFRFRHKIIVEIHQDFNLEIALMVSLIQMFYIAEMSSSF